MSSPAPPSAASRALGSPLFLLAVLALAAALRVWHVLAIRELPLFDRLILDSELYDAWAQHVAAGDWLTAVLGRPFYMDPLYSYFLAGVYALFGRDLLLVRLIQVAFGVATCGVTALVGRAVAGAAVGNVAALLIALYRPAVFQEGEFEKTALGVLLATLSLWLFLLRPAWARALAGAALGVAALTRGNVLLLAPFALGALLARREWRPAAGFVAGLAVVLAPVAWRNHHVGSEWILTVSAAGQNLYTGNNPANPDGGYHSVPFVRPQTAHEEGDFLAEANRRTGRSLTAGEASSFWVGETLRHVAASPGFAARVLLRKVGLFWSDVELADAWGQDFVARFSLPLRLPLPSFALLAGLGALGVWPALRSPRGRTVLAYVAVYSASVVAFFVFSRYRLHVVPALAVLSAMGLAWAADEVRSRGPGPVAVPLALAAAVALWSALSFPSRRGEGVKNDADLAEMYQERRDFEAAARVLASASERAPGDAHLLCAHAKLRLRTGDGAGAVDAARRCLGANPVFPDGWYLLGLGLEAAGDRAGAADAHRRQLALVPGHEASAARLERLR